MNYQKELDKILDEYGNENKKLFLHSCCAPCSSYVIEYLSQYFDIVVFYYNPNITEQTEYKKRVKEQQRLISSMPHKHKVEFLEGAYEPDLFFSMARGLEKCREGEERCFGCYELRLRKTAIEAKMRGFDYFTTTLTISPLKKAEIINEIGMRLEKVYDISFLPSDFKKRNGYLRSIDLSKEYNLYRQDYCGCCYSKAAREAEKEITNAKDD